jgi:hypothetical protein
MVFGYGDRGRFQQGGLLAATKASRLPMQIAYTLKGKGYRDLDIYKKKSRFPQKARTDSILY